MDRGSYYTFQSCREVVSRSDSCGAGNGQWRVVSRADVVRALCGWLWWHSQMAASNRPVQAFLQLGRLGTWAVMDWGVELTAYTFGGRSNCQYNCRGRASRVLIAQVSAWVRLRARARK